MKNKIFVLHTAILIIFIMLTSGCASKHIAMKPKVSESTVHTEHSVSLHGFFNTEVGTDALQSGYYPLEYNLDAFAARIAYIKNAKKRLDLQYYLFVGDNIGFTMLKHILDAADRGVKVRIILDDILMGKASENLMAVDGHPNISIKLFNPTNFRGMLRWIEMAFHINTMGRRMHNKAIVVDNSVAIIGGRNIQDIYFSADRDTVFIDNDILIAGPLVAEISNEFEIYWNSEVCIPMGKVSGETDLSLKELHKEMDEYVKSFVYTDYRNAVNESTFAHKFRAREIDLIYGEGKLYFDLPTKVTTSEEETGSHLSEHMRPIVFGAKKRLWIVSPYFMPNEKFMKEIETLRQKGVDVAILTNSLATNDGIPVYSAYSKYHKELLRLGVRLYELSPHAFQHFFKDSHYKKGKIPRSSLHAKSMIIDDDTFIIGSANMDPRSHKLNTELVAVINSHELVEIQKSVFKRMIAPENSYELGLEPTANQKPYMTGMPIEKERVVWKGIVDNKPVKYYNDGNAGFWRVFGSNISAWFSIEGYL